MNKTVETRTEEITLRDDGIVYCVAKQGIILTLKDAKENILAISKLANGKKVPVLVDIRGATEATKEARKYFSNDEVAEVQSAVAMLVDSGFSKLLGNFFIGLNRPLFPIRLFMKEQEALRWLENFQSENVATEK